MTVTLVNMSALGIYRFGWTDPEGAPCEIQWGSGLRDPLVFRNNVVRDLRHPERWGWAEPRNAAAFKAFVARFADDWNASFDDEDETGEEAGEEP